MRKALLGFLLVVLVAGGIFLYWVGPWRTGGSAGSPTSAPTPPSGSPPFPPITPTISPPYLTVRIVALTGSGLTRTATAQLVNDGGTTATGVYAVAEFFAGTTKVMVNGQDALRVEVGRVEAGQRVERTVELRFSLLDGLRLQRSGGRVVLTVYADQGIWRFEEAFQP